MIKVFPAPRFSDEQDLRLLSFEGIQKVDSPREADLILVPQFVRGLKPETMTYLASVRALAEKEERPAVVFKGGDLAYRFSIPGFTVFSSSLYRQKNRGEYASPAPIEDLSLLPWTPREKRDKPVISFCGYAGFSSVGARFKYVLKNLFLTLSPQYRRGIYWRRKSMQFLERDARLATNFIVRERFSGKSGVEGSAAERQEYIESIKSADFVLCPKGDGNYSARFYETLALGRIPVLVDTDMVLPLEGLIEYDRFIIRVPYTDIGNIASYIMERWNALSDTAYEAMQVAARRAFLEHLRYDKFIERAFSIIKEKGSAN